MDIIKESNDCVMVSPDYDAESKREYAIILNKKGIDLNDRFLIIKDGNYYRVME